MLEWRCRLGNGEHPPDNNLHEVRPLYYSIVVQLDELSNSLSIYQAADTLSPLVQPTRELIVADDEHEIF